MRTNNGIKVSSLLLLLWLVLAYLAASLVVGTVFFLLFGVFFFLADPDVPALIGILFTAVPKFESGLLASIPLHLPILVFSVTKWFTRWHPMRKVIYWVAAILINVIWVMIAGVGPQVTPLGIGLAIVAVYSCILLTMAFYKLFAKKFSARAQAAALR